jgi:predicted ATPase
VAAFRANMRPDCSDEMPSQLSAAEFLQRASLLRDGRLTFAGALLFGENPAAVLPTAIVQCSHFYSNTKDSSVDKTDLRGTIPEQIVRARDFVAELARCGDAPTTEGAYAQPVYDYPMIAVREIIANALVHRDYEHRESCVHVRVYVDRVEILNPGVWGNGLEDVYNSRLGELERESSRRNFRLASVLTWSRLVEGEGTGIRRAINDCSRAGAPEPTVTQAHGIVCVTVYPRSDAIEVRRTHVPRTLPRDTAAFIGRHHELQQLLGATRETTASEPVIRIHAIDGMPGVGKTALAIHAAHLLAHEFPDGQLFLSLQAHTSGRPVEAADALFALLTADGVPPARVPSALDERVAVWRTRMANRRALLILDDAQSQSQVEPLLPGATGCFVLITSRRRLTGLSVRHNAMTLSLNTLPPNDAAMLFARLTGRTLNEHERSAVAELVRMCGYLPLAISLVATKLRPEPLWTITDLLEDLGAAQSRLNEISAEDVSIAASLDASYRNLPAARRRFFLRLSLHPGVDVDANAAAALGNVPVTEARQHLEALYNDHMIDQPMRGRYRMHDLIREYAQQLAAQETGTD